MGDILIILGAVLALIVFILIMIGGVMFIGSLFGGVLDWLMEPARRRDEARAAELSAIQTCLHAQSGQARALADIADAMQARNARTSRKQRGSKTPSAPIDVMEMPDSPLVQLHRHETRIARCLH